MTTCHVVFFPFMAYGHMIPMADMAVLFSSRGLRTTIVATSSTAHRLSKSIQKTINYTHQIALHTIEFKANEAGLPPVIDNPDHIITNQHHSRLLEAISTLQEPFEQFIEKSQPNCIVADMFFPWTVETAARFNIPRIAFNGTGFFPLCVADVMRLYRPTVSSDSESFVVPNLPHEIKLTRKQLPQIESEEFKVFVKVFIQAAEAEAKSYGVIFNSFYELEPEYVHHYREVMKRKAWHVGPVSLCSKNTEDKLERGKKSAIDEHQCLRWLDSKAPNSVIYVSFGSMVKVPSSQLYEIAMALEACDENFIWVVRNDQEAMITDGFEARIKAKGKGLIIKGWAPQVLILDHESVGGFVTHCGWNSVLEGVSCGVAMVAWPVMAEQFYNAKLVTDVLQIGVLIGDVEWSPTSTCDGVKREAIQRAVAMVMGVEEGHAMRTRARELKEKAKTAVEEGGSSYSDLTTFVEDINAFRNVNGPTF
ncbi:putative scopoletin glucosyltransferase [Helianthus annuus]|nr:putative scopoletin glucosyltransferase [Helianthus annuus]KAJ0884279.1 putative scopoletin glucosyltransferase [Helianthus annuus]